MLSSAVFEPQSSFGGIDLYETLHEKAAALLRGLAGNHAFADGNKRTAWSATQIFLVANQSPLYQVNDNEAADFVEKQVVVGKASVKEIAQWLIFRMAL